MFRSPALSQKTWKRQVAFVFPRKGSSVGCEIRQPLRHAEGEPSKVNCAKMKRDVVAPGLGIEYRDQWLERYEPRPNAETQWLTTPK